MKTRTVSKRFAKSIASLRKKAEALSSSIESKLLNADGSARDLGDDDAKAVDADTARLIALEKRIATLEKIVDAKINDDEEEDDAEEDMDDEEDEEADDEDSERDDDDDEDSERSMRFETGGSRFDPSRFSPRSARRDSRDERPRGGRRSKPWQQGKAPAAHTRQWQYSYSRALSWLAKPHTDAGLEREVSRHMELTFNKTADGILLPTGGEEDRRGEPLFKGIRGISPLGASRRSRRDVDTTTGSGAVFVRPELPFIEVLRNALVMKAIGAQFWPNLPPGKFSIPRQNSASSAYWLGELDSTGTPVTISNPSVAQQVAFVDKTLACLVPISRKFLFQASGYGEANVKDDMSKVMAIEIDRSAVNGSGSGAVPTGLLQNSTIQTISSALALGTNGGEFSFATSVNMEKLVSVANAALGKLNYLTCPTLAGLLKQTLKVPGSSFPIYVLEGVPGSNSGDPRAGVMNGRDVYSSNIVPNNLVKGSASNCCAAIFGNWDDLIIAQWGGIDALVNPYSYQGQGVVAYSMFTEIDIEVRHPESFTIVSDALPT